ncbi:PQQ-dependent sugar dehydrogenase [Adhaeribacter pallidiroseus]|uniref:HHIP-like protein n=1 Tax=Adhaeribacter pallidiroseus TaxID=2072847 RepID=A0A369QLX8_9BACT|nr:PQQ-dependent sugar dehydrogenase [Adhaeribacter pallidiroseus]RDC65943.1 HHIP-like protein [Adhaeribacter pallidiroseus]
MKQPKNLLVLSFLLILMSCEVNKSDDNNTPDPGQNPVVPSGYTLTEAFSTLKFDKPVELTSPTDGTNRIFVVSQTGKIHVFPNDATAATAPVYLDISSKVTSGGELGLLGLAFHPDYKTNGYFYVNYTRGNPLETVISRFKVSSSDPNVADPGSEQVLLTYQQPFSNHNGGKLAFGNDGYLYIASGDGGSGGDPQNYAQNRTQLLGKIIRIDVNSTTGNLPYAIPADNPYRNNNQGFREEIYAYGLRNPWRFSFDRKTGTLWAGDVGQGNVEEISIIKNGGNYGWKIREGNTCFGAANCDVTGLEEPVWTYPLNNENGRSVTGGYVCHDKNLIGLADKYIYGDYVSGNVWALTVNGNQMVKNELITKLPDNISSFGEDSQQGLYVLGYGTGKIFKFTPKP